MKKVLFFCLSIYILIACDDPTIKDSSSSALFVNMESLIDQQSRLLDSVKPAVRKEVVVNGQTEKQQLSTIEWAKELAIFKELDISKAGLQDSYIISNPAAGTRVYTLKSGEHAVVQELRVQFASDTTHISKIEGIVMQKNYLYQSEKLLALEFQESASQQASLKDYQIVTKKKILFGDEESMKIQASLVK